MTQVQIKWIILAIVIILSYVLIKPFLIVVILAAMCALLFFPMKERIEKILPRKNITLSSLITVIIAIGIVTIPITVFGSVVVSEASDFYYSLNFTNFDLLHIKQYLKFLPESVVEKMVMSIGQIGESFGKYLSNGVLSIVRFAGNIAGFGLSVFIFLISFFYFLRDSYKLKYYFERLSPLPDDSDAKIISRLEEAIKAVVRGQFLTALVQALVSGLGFYIIGLPNATLWILATFFAALVPSVGTAIVLVPVLIYVFLTGNTAQFVFFLVWSVAAVGLIDNFLGPKFIGQKLPVHPLIVLLSIFGGVAAFGVFGIIFGPVLASMLVTLLTIYLQKE